MKRHKSAGMIVKVQAGKYEGQFFKVIDYFQNQFQGKAMHKLVKIHRVFLGPVESRGFPLDEEVVFGQLYPNMTYACMHDDELQIKEGKPQPTLKLVKEKEDDIKGTSGRDIKPTRPRRSRTGRIASSEEASGKDNSDNSKASKADSKASSRPRGESKDVPRGKE